MAYERVINVGEESARSMGSSVPESAAELVTNTAEALIGGSEAAREATKSVQKVAGNLKGALDKSIHDQPIATIAVAVAVGFVFGALWKA